MTTVVDKLTGLVDKMSSHPITLEGELDSTPRYRLTEGLEIV